MKLKCLYSDYNYKRLLTANLATDITQPVTVYGPSGHFTGTTWISEGVWSLNQSQHPNTTGPSGHKDLRVISTVIWADEPYIQTGDSRDSELVLSVAAIIIIIISELGVYYDSICVYDSVQMILIWLCQHEAKTSETVTWTWTLI